MSLIYCQKCGNKMSSNAAACPKCGAANIPGSLVYNNTDKTVKKKSRVGLVIVILLLLSACIVCAILLPSLTKSNKEDTNTDNAANAITDSTANAMLDTGDNDTSEYSGEKTETKYDVSLSVYIRLNPSGLSTYSVDVLVDGHSFATLEGGDSKNISLKLTKGVHKIQFRENGNESNTLTVTETITGDTSLSYNIKRHKGKMNLA